MYIIYNEIKETMLKMNYLTADSDFVYFDRYFSYEHFYVIYCKFWELDTDHDFLIDKDDLLRYGNHSLTWRIVDRMFSQVFVGVNLAMCVFRMFTSKIYD